MMIKKNGARNNAVGRAKPAQASHSPARNQRCRVNASRVASRAKNTTTRCAVNQYVPNAARYQNGVPRAKSSVIQRRADSVSPCGGCVCELSHQTMNPRQVAQSSEYTRATSIAPRTTLNKHRETNAENRYEGSIIRAGIGDPATNQRPLKCSRS
jgi:hypothetical protein